MSEHNDYDSPWKMVLDAHFQEAMHLYFPDIAAQIDWDVPVKSLEQEFQQVSPEGEAENKRVDKLVDVQLLTGASVWLLIHIEIQKQPQPDFAKRMFVYHYRIFDRYGRHPVSTAILTDNNAGWRPIQYTHSQHGCTMQLDFRVAKLLDYNESDLLASSNPFALVTLAQMLETKAGKSADNRYRVKLRLMRLLLNAGYNRNAIENLLRFIDWILKLPDGLNTKLRSELAATMPKEKLMYVTSFERIAEKRGVQYGREQGLEKGLEQGLEQGRELELEQSILLRLNKYHLVVPADLETAIRALQLDDLRDLLLFIEPDVSLDVVAERVAAYADDGA